MVNFGLNVVNDWLVVVGRREDRGEQRRLRLLFRWFDTITIGRRCV